MSGSLSRLPVLTTFQSPVPVKKGALAMAFTPVFHPEMALKWL